MILTCRYLGERRGVAGLLPAAFLQVMVISYQLFQVMVIFTNNDDLQMIWSHGDFYNNVKAGHFQIIWSYSDLQMIWSHGDFQMKSDLTNNKTSLSNELKVETNIKSL